MSEVVTDFETATDPALLEKLLRQEVNAWRAQEGCGCEQLGEELDGKADGKGSAAGLQESATAKFVGMYESPSVTPSTSPRRFRGIQEDSKETVRAAESKEDSLSGDS